MSYFNSMLTLEFGDNISFFIRQYRRTKHTKDSIRIAAELLSLKELPLDKLITSKFPFERIEDALKEAREITSYRPVVNMED